jgi:myb proto-oncogene protein
VHPRKPDGGTRRAQHRWTAEEDKQLLALMVVHKTDWKVIEGHMGGRSGKKCRERYVNHLQPGIKK